jgi:hypothetical protein
MWIHDETRDISTFTHAQNLGFIPANIRSAKEKADNVKAGAAAVGAKGDIFPRTNSPPPPPPCLWRWGHQSQQFLRKRGRSRYSLYVTHTRTSTERLGGGRCRWRGDAFSSFVFFCGWEWEWWGGGAAGGGGGGG